MCLACEKEGSITRCLSGTGDGTVTCDAYKLQLKAVEQINNTVTEIKNEASSIMSKFTSASQAISSAKNKLQDFLSTITSIRINQIPSFDIQPIPLISVGSLNFDSIQPIDIGSSVIQPAINSFLIPLNAVISGIKTSINSVSNTINNTIPPINSVLNSATSTLRNVIGGINSATGAFSKIGITIPSIPDPTIPVISGHIDGININNINNITLSCPLDVAKLLKDAIGETINVGNIVVNVINTTIIPGLNISFAAIKNGINIAIDNINRGFKIAIETIINSVKHSIDVIENQLSSLNIFSGLTNKILDIFSQMKGLNISGIITTYVMPYVNAIVPSAQVFDVIVFCLLVFFTPFILDGILLFNSVVNLIPDLDIPIFPNWYSPYETAKGLVSDAVDTVSNAIDTASNAIDNAIDTTSNAIDNAIDTYQ